MSETIDDFIRSLKATAGSRFNAAKRLEYVDRWLTILSSFASAYLILLSVIPTIMSVDSSHQPVINLFSVALSVLLLASTVSTYSGNYAVKAEQFHRSALEIQEVRRALRYSIEGENDEKFEFERLSKEYDAILQKYSINHEDVDFWRFQTEFPDLYSLTPEKQKSLKKRIIIAHRYPQFTLAAITLAVISLLAWLLC